ncbi:hypothetical protein DM02DRAFT_675522 [Periconia macrospinosa]|uniref:polynucleotide adenylyltransferase n=1 Tax=Periconia macrospinosa TaxID=97972 RepID=A0A2V1DBH1_9PLEO|nr:hypothetical protein DM02DRAFT_675522 [Periconia macrospinosa]
MAASAHTAAFESFATTSYDTALCIIPPEEDCKSIESLRSLYDKGYGRWPPHINLIYPFVAPENLPRAKSQIENSLRNNIEAIPEQAITLDQAGYFEHRNNSTVFLRDSADSSQNILASLRSLVLKSLGNDDSPCNFHLTIGQANDETQSNREFLLSKARLIPAMTFTPWTLVILTRENFQIHGERSSRMRVWGSIDVFNTVASHTALRESWIDNEAPPKHILSIEATNDDASLSESSSYSRQAEPGLTYRYDPNTQQWIVAHTSPETMPLPKLMSVSSYNVLIDSEHPPARDRDSLLLDTILSKYARAHVLVLQEVSDDFLSYLLNNDDIREQYPFTSHAPPSQSNIGPLPSLRNIVVLSKWMFSWEFVPFQRRHKGAIVAKIPQITGNGATEGLPLVVAGVHLTCGLTDGSVAAKKVQLQNVTNYLKRKYPDNPWVLAGDFNITTSEHTIREAVKSRSISAQTEETLHAMENMLLEVGFLDSWVVARVEGISTTTQPDANDLFEGEEGATFNPRENALAATTSGTSRNRPQRYDRILYRPQDFLYVAHFNDFGLPETRNGLTQVPSDHSGIRAVLKLGAATKSTSVSHSEILSQYTIEHKEALSSLSSGGDVMHTLQAYSVFPTAEEKDERKRAFDLVKSVILDTTSEGSSKSEIPLVMTAVGSYALGVWTSDSDIDCLCIGTISSKTFFSLAIQRIHRDESQSIRLLRKVEANTGTMLEISVNGITMDLQYCPAAAVVYRWSEFANLQSSDSIFNLPISSLRKLKPLRDLNAIQRTMPAKASFRLAYHYIKLWAVERGIYSGKFGFLSGTHITLMLSWVCKRLAHDTGSVNAGDLIVSFFHHYAIFDWQNDMVFDAFFHTQKPRYHRSAREPMVILGYHAPHANIAHTATTPGVQILVKEFQRAASRLSTPGMTWSTFFEAGSDSAPSSALTMGAGQFLRAHDNYVKIDIQYWGRTLSKGRGLVGWIESRCINLVVEIHKALPHVSVRIWPARFAEPNANATATEYYGCYLIGLSRNQESEATNTIEDRAQAKQALETTLDRFLTQIRGDEKYYDKDSCWIDASIAKQGDVKDMVLDDREWGDYAMDIESDSDDEQEVDDDDAAADDSISSVPQKLPHRGAVQSSVPVSTSKLRPASDVLNRLRWDTNLDMDDYIVGYEDRFIGAREMPLGKWKTEQTDMEFIPQHRILYFKRKGESGDGGGAAEVIWERATRIDKVFGSGVGSGGSVE